MYLIVTFKHVDLNVIKFLKNMKNLKMVLNLILKIKLEKNILKYCKKLREMDSISKDNNNLIIKIFLLNISILKKFQSFYKKESK